MRRSITVAAILIAAMVVGTWYWASPYFAIAGLRNAVVRSDASELESRVDFPRFRDSIRMQLLAFIMAGMKEQLSDNPFATLGLALAVKLTDVMVDSMVTPTGMLTLMDLKTNGESEVSGLALMASSEISIRRKGVESFDFYSAKDKKQTPILHFTRHGLQWKLVGLQMPKEFLESKTRDTGVRRQAAAPHVPKWELGEHKNPMDDTVRVLLHRDADEEVAGRFSAVRPTLVFTCRDKKLGAYINFRGMVDYNRQTDLSALRLRFDDRTAKLEGWGISESREALFAPDPRAFLRTLLEAKVLLVEWRQYGERTSIAKFTRGDLETHVGKLAAACGVGSF